MDTDLLAIGVFYINRDLSTTFTFHHFWEVAKRMIYPKS